jgi:hypothetical protein
MKAKRAQAIGEAVVGHQSRAPKEWHGAAKTLGALDKSSRQLFSHQSQAALSSYAASHQPRDDWS